MHIESLCLSLVYVGATATRGSFATTMQLHIGMLYQFFCLVEFVTKKYTKIFGTTYTKISVRLEESIYTLRAQIKVALD